MKFWKNRWFGDTPLSVSFSTIFEVTSDEDAWVGSQIQDNDWALIFSSPLSSQRLQVLAKMVDVLQKHNIIDSQNQVS